MRIGMFTSSLPEPARKPGGVDVLIARVASRLADRGHEVRMYSYSPGPAGVEYEHVLLEPRRFAQGRLERMLLVPFALNQVDWSGLDVLHLHGDDWFFFRRPLPTVRTFYGSARDEARTATSVRRRAAQSLIFRLELLSSRLATSTYALTPDGGRAYGSEGILGCGIEPTTSSLPRTQHPTILFVGTWAGRKRGRLVAEAFESYVRPALPTAELWMVADEAKAAPGLRHFARPSDEELASLYRQAWVFTLPSAYEGLGIPYLEAMAAATPVVATHNPGADYLLDGSGAAVLASPEELGSALVTVLSNEGLREELGAAGRRRAQDFSWDKVLSDYEAAYRAAIDRWSERRSSSSSRRKSATTLC